MMQLSGNRIWGASLLVTIEIRIPSKNTLMYPPVMQKQASSPKIRKIDRVEE